MFEIFYETLSPNPRSVYMTKFPDYLTLLQKITLIINVLEERIVLMKRIEWASFLSRNRDTNPQPLDSMTHRTYTGNEQ